MATLSSRTGRPRQRHVRIRAAGAALAHIGGEVRARRLQAGLTQQALAGLSNTGPRFIRELEQGKPTLEIGKVLDVLQTLGLRVVVDLQRPLKPDVPMP